MLNGYPHSSSSLGTERNDAYAIACLQQPNELKLTNLPRECQTPKSYTNERPTTSPYDSSFQKHSATSTSEPSSSSAQEGRERTCQLLTSAYPPQPPPGVILPFSKPTASHKTNEAPTQATTERKATKTEIPLYTCIRGGGGESNNTQQTHLLSRFTM